MKAIVVRPNETPVVEDRDWNYKDIQEVVGGTIESLPHVFSEVSMFGNDEAKLLNLEFNGIASIMCSSRLHDGDIITGPVVIIGFDPETGDNLDLPEHMERIVFFCEKVANFYEFMSSLHLY